LIELQMPRLHLAQVILKRTVDVVLSALGILLLAPLLVAVAVGVKVESPGPVFFRQKRLGLGGEPFTIFKFRSMRKDAEEILAGNEELNRRHQENGFKLPESEDPRISAFGAFLRKSSLDELPQLFNVLKGDMSLVGPRPIVVPELEHYGEGASTFLAVRPGVTGQWQINGRSEVGYPQRALLDIDYIREWSLGSDLDILVRTVPAVIRRKGAH
jgi:lipopolysaccharide/colanic/teichoic acid biosynthesis glycosyltransferase